MQLKQFVKQYLKHRNSIAVIVVIAIVLIIAGFLFKNEFSIQQIEIIGAPRSLLIQGLDDLKQTNLLLLSEADVQAKLLNLNPNLRQVNIIKNYPHSIIISVVLQTPSAALQTNSGYFIIDESAHLLQRVKIIKTLNYPIITYYQKLDYDSFAPGDVIDNKDILASLQFLRKAQELGLVVNAIDIKGFSMIALQVDTKSIYFSLEKDIKAQTFQFETVIKQFRIEGRDFGKLDFRFEKPIVTNNL